MKKLAEFITKRVILADKATEGKWRVVPADSWCAYPHVVTSDGQYALEDHDGHEPSECRRKPFMEGCGLPGKDETAYHIVDLHNNLQTMLKIIEIQAAAINDAHYALSDCSCDDPEQFGHDNTNCNVAIDLEFAQNQIEALLDAVE